MEKKNSVFRCANEGLIVNLWVKILSKNSVLRCANEALIVDLWVKIVSKNGALRCAKEALIVRCSDISLNRAKGNLNIHTTPKNRRKGLTNTPC